MTESPLTLSGLEPFAVGGRRLCFVHPEDPSRVIKTLRRDPGRFVKTGRSMAPAALRREYDNNVDEFRTLRRLEERIGAGNFRHLPRCHGWVETDLGRGLVLDLIRDADGKISRSAREALQRGCGLEELRPAWEEMGAYFVRHGVLTRAILDHNLAAQRLAGGGWRLHLIDGFGDRVAIPVRSLVPGLRRATVRRRLADGWRRLEQVAEEVAAGRKWDTERWGQGFLEHRGA